MENTTSSESVILKAVDKIYDAVINGSVPGTDSAAELAESYLAEIFGIGRNRTALNMSIRSIRQVSIGISQ